MAHHEISPGQFKGLLLLLVLGPLIPTALMLRLMFESVQIARGETRDQMEQTYQRSLAIVTNSMAHQWENNNPPKSEAPAKILKFYHIYLDPDVIIRLVDENHQVLAENRTPQGEPIAAIGLKDPYANWQIQVFLKGQNALVSSTEEQIGLFAWTAGTAVFANLIIATVAGFAVHRQMKMHELKNSTLATVSHELRTPLASMRVLLDTLREGRYRNEDQLHEYLEMAARENHRLTRLIENFLTLSRIERGVHVFNKKPLTPNEIVQTALEAMHLKLNATGIETRLADDLPPISADRDTLVTALVNLLENAWKYSGDEKKISLETRREGNRVIFTVEDNGIGIPKSERAKIFRRYYQVDQKLSRSAEGCGLGLSIVKHIVDAHGGEISLESEPGKGSRFLIKIPVT